VSFGFGGVANASEVRVGTTPATAVYLGTEKVWPIYVGNLSGWFKPNPTTGNGSQTAIYIDWPAGAEFCDVIFVGGGAGGTGTGIGGNPQKGGGEGQWQGFTIPRTGELQTDNTGGTQGQPITYNRLFLQWLTPPGGDGVGGGNFNTLAADGSYMTISPRDYASINAQKTGPIRVGNRSLDQTSNTGNRNGGNVAESFTFNGRTYTMASYGTNAGRGGATSNKNGGPGNAPGGGGQSADNGGLTGYNGGDGAHGAAILYWY
jgi:hypothetical protein